MTQSNRHNEVTELHPSVAKWLQNKKWIYEYESWLNANNRIDFLAFDMMNDQFVLCEVGNYYDSIQDLSDKFRQCERYHALFPSYRMILFLPNDYNLLDDFVKYFANLYEIEIIYIEIHDFIDNYDEFIKTIYPNYIDERQPNKGTFKKF